MKPIIDTVTTPPELFRELLDKIWEVQNLPLTNDYLMVESYLVDVLMEFFCKEKGVLNEYHLNTILYLLLPQNGREANLRIKYIGDTALLVSGVFTAQKLISHRILGTEYYIQTAATAYQKLYERIIREVGQAVTFNTLAADIHKFVRVFSHVLVEGNVGIELEVVTAVWKRYVNTGDQKNLEWLREQGIYIPEKDILQ
ncbi:MAG: hypothetical protein HYT98_04070 [Candidatus Sungbacteria bacterium]|nr:hypothetical protein [Candidatus Sungbacteria bacterium]